MKSSTKNFATVIAGLTLTGSMLVVDAFAGHGFGGGRPGGGMMMRSGGGVSRVSNNAQFRPNGQPMNHATPIGNFNNNAGNFNKQSGSFKPNTQHFPNGGLKNGQFQKHTNGPSSMKDKMGPNKNNGQFKNLPHKGQNNHQQFAHSKNGQFWKKYNGWGKSGNGWQHHHHWGYGWGWGWGSWVSPWVLYQPIPVVQYCNPYCATGAGGVDGVDYSTPINQMPEPAGDPAGDPAADAAADAATDPAANPAGDPAAVTEADPNADPNAAPANGDSIAAARDAFRRGDLNASLAAITQAVARSPRDRDVHQFHSLVLFAQKDFAKSAAVAHAVLEDGPGWTWDMLQTLYASPSTYTEQLRGLEQFVNANPSVASVRFLLAYHYLMLNHVDSAKRQLAQVVQLEPKDTLAARILQAVSGKPGSTTSPNTSSGPPADSTTPETEDSNPAPQVVKTPAASSPIVQTASVLQSIVGPTAKKPYEETMKSDAGAKGNTADSADVAAISGKWSAKPTDSIQIELTLRSDKTFDWKFTSNGQSKAFAGKFNVKDKALVLSRADGDEMEGVIAMNGSNGFQFKMRDADPSDPGLTFTR